jgi:hypothetical protein
VCVGVSRVGDINNKVHETWMQLERVAREPYYVSRAGERFNDVPNVTLVT